MKTNKIAFTALSVDQVQEHVNKSHKGHGGISGITNSPETLMRYCLSTPELSRISKETERMLGQKETSVPNIMTCHPLQQTGRKSLCKN